jgi:hypothetical protein
VCRYPISYIAIRPTVELKQRNCGAVRLLNSVMLFYHNFASRNA